MISAIEIVASADMMAAMEKYFFKWSCFEGLRVLMKQFLDHTGLMLASFGKKMVYMRFPSSSYAKLW